MKKEFAEKACELEMVKESLTEKSTEHNKACIVIQKMVSNIKQLERENEKLKNSEVKKCLNNLHDKLNFMFDFDSWCIMIKK